MEVFHFHVSLDLHNQQCELTLVLGGSACEIGATSTEQLPLICETVNRKQAVNNKKVETKWDGFLQLILKYLEEKQQQEKLPDLRKKGRFICGKSSILKIVNFKEWQNLTLLPFTDGSMASRHSAGDCTPVCGYILPHIFAHPRASHRISSQRSCPSLYALANKLWCACKCCAWSCP